MLLKILVLQDQPPVVHRRGDVAVRDVGVLLLEGGQLVEVCCEQRVAVHLLHEVLWDRPRQPEAVVRRRASPELVDDHQRRRRGGADDRRRLEHLRHERGHAARLRVARTHTAEDGREDGQTRTLTGHEGAQLRKDGKHTRLRREDMIWYDRIE